MGSLARKMRRNATRSKTTMSSAPSLYNLREDVRVRQAIRQMDQQQEERHDRIRVEQERIAALDPALKGKKGGNCNRTACQKPHAIFFHHSTRAYYCATCTHMLNFDKFNHADAQRLYGHLLVQVGESAYEDLKVLSLTPMGQTRAVERALEMAEDLTERGEVYHA